MIDGQEILTQTVEWVRSQQPRLQAHVPPEYPWVSREQHLASAQLQRLMLFEACGEWPLTFLAIQDNVKRGYGQHSHLLHCGSAQLLEARRTVVHREFVRRVERYQGIDQPGHFVRTPSGGTEWTPGVPNRCRFRLTPVYAGPRGDVEIVAYCVRYVLREDVELALEVLSGDACV
jgi:hypothetical protein